MVFVGRDRVEAKRRALDYWYRRGRLTGQTLGAFLAACRLGSDGRSIAFYPDGDR